MNRTRGTPAEPSGSLGKIRNHTPLFAVSRWVCRVSVEEGYDLWAKAYDRDPNPLLALEERVLKPMLSDLRGKDVLDVACGTGRWLEKLLSAGARSGAGIDFSTDMLAAARAKPTLHGRLVRADCLALPFRDGLIDLLVCSFLVSHVRDLAPLASEIGRVVRGKADVYLTDLHPSGYSVGWRAGFRDEIGPVEIATFTHSVGQVRAAFEAEGFRLTEFMEPCLGEPEKLIFAKAGKAYRFGAACRVPAIFICHFKRLASTRGAETGR